MLQSMGSQRVGHGLMTELNWGRCRSLFRAFSLQFSPCSLTLDPTLREVQGHHPSSTPGRCDRAGARDRTCCEFSVSSWAHVFLQGAQSVFLRQALHFLGHSVSVNELSSKGFKPAEPVWPEASATCGLLRSGCSRRYGGHRLEREQWPPDKRVSDGIVRPRDGVRGVQTEDTVTDKRVSDGIVRPRDGVRGADRGRCHSPGPQGLVGVTGAHTGGIPWTQARFPVPPATGSRTGSRSLLGCVSSSEVEAGPPAPYRGDEGP